MSASKVSLLGGCHHYNELGEVPWDIQKYWQQRYSIFSKYDEGILMTDDSWFGITPEPVANKIAERLSRAKADTIIDAFSGAGGNTIAFARTGKWKKIIAIEKDPEAIKCAKHNAKVYGVENNIHWIKGDCFEVLRDEAYGFVGLKEQCVIFASPPWGGPGYRSNKVFDLSTMQPYPVHEIYESFAKVSTDIALYLPRTSDLRQLTYYSSETHKLEVVHYCMEGASKAICAYLGGLGLP